MKQPDQRTRAEDFTLVDQFQHGGQRNPAHPTRLLQIGRLANTAREMTDVDLMGSIDHPDHGLKCQ